MWKCQKPPTTRWDWGSKFTLFILFVCVCSVAHTQSQLNELIISLRFINHLLHSLISLRMEDFSWLPLTIFLQLVFNTRIRAVVLYDFLDLPTLFLCLSSHLRAHVCWGKAAIAHKTGPPWVVLHPLWKTGNRVIPLIKRTKWHVGAEREDLFQAKDEDKKPLYCETSFSCM